MDLSPTLLAMAGFSSESALDGFDLSHLLLNKGGEEEAGVAEEKRNGKKLQQHKNRKKSKRTNYLYFSQQTDQVAAIRHKQFKLIHQVCQFAVLLMMV